MTDSATSLRELHQAYSWINTAVYNSEECTRNHRYECWADHDKDIIVSRPDKNRVDQMSGLIQMLCEAFAERPSIPLDTLRGRTLASWLVKLQAAIEDIGSADYILGEGHGGLLIEASNARWPRKQELSDFVAKAAITAEHFTWAALARADRIRLAKLLLTVAAGIRMEEFNRMKNIDNLHYFAARKLAALESLRGQPIFDADSEARFLQAVERAAEVEEYELDRRNFQRCILAETKHRYVYCDRGAFCRDTFAHVAEALFGTPEAGQDDEAVRQRIVEEYIFKVGIRKAIAELLVVVRNEFSDDAAILAAMTSREMRPGDVVTAWGAFLGGVYGYDALVEDIGDGSLEIRKLHDAYKIIGDCQHGNRRSQSWRRTREDLDGIADERTRRQRIAVFESTIPEHPGDSELEAKYLAALFGRLVVVKLNKKLNSRQTFIQDPMIGNHMAYDKSGAVADAESTRIGLQSGLLVPLVFGHNNRLSDIRFMRESTRQEAGYRPGDLTKARAYAKWAEILLAAHLAG